MDKVAGYETYKLPPRWLFLKVETEDGLTGWGEPIIEGRADTVRTAVRELMDDYIVGNSIDQIEDHWQVMYRGGFFRGGPILMSAIGGIDQALWDLKGRRYDTPVFQLLGGRTRERVRVYQNISGEDVDEVRDRATDAVSEGYTALKLFPASNARYVESAEEIEAICEQVRVVREAVGKAVDLAVDLHGRISASMSNRLCSRLDAFDLLFVEEPVRPEHVLSLERDAWDFETPIALGERLYTRWEVKTHLEQVPVDVVQPDPSHAGGITEVRKIADLADTHGVGLALNCSVGPIASAACLQLNAYASNTIVQPTPENQYSTGYLSEEGVLEHRDGYLDIPSRPGLGITIDEAAVKEASGSASDWKMPTWRHDDMSFAEW